ncbi:Ca-activated chloride channel family protein [Flavobacterium lindanitolerans]|uniref:Ca-activated chloride channel family protein n=1 Tax=Flavobacterium lindanitolerans TaxID=428988 RepID=A0A497V2J4_9FLAO|nr:Ca-activated chloride channel family protein [Flavobacterium lindanitolerans]RLJ34745.1 Ca-activated chloride channel family protein [Flavobacterium lindanitolerans]
MENQDKIFEQFKDASKKAETKDFPAMEKVWNRVEEKLDKKDDKKTIALWKKIGIAASLLLFFSLGYQFLKTDETTIDTPKNPVVTQEKENTISNSEKEAVVDNSDITVKPEKTETKTSKIIKSKAVSIKTDAVAVAEDTKEKEEVYSKATEIAGVEITQAKPKAETLKEAKIIVAETKTDPVTNEKTVIGTVVDGQNLPLPGVNVVVKGTTRGTQTDYDGKYSIAVNPNEQLAFSFVGYKSTTVPVKDQSRLDIALSESSEMLSEVIVTAYTSTKRTKSSAAVKPIESGRKSKKEAALDPSGSFANGHIAQNNSTDNKLYRDGDKNGNPTIQSLQGAVAGLNIGTGSGQPGGDTSIVIRGNGSVNDNNEPLYIVDGMPVDEEGFRKLTQNNIEEITVLKDASATAIYGNRGINGVIVIKTKNGTNQKLSKRELRKKLRELKQKKNTEVYRTDEHTEDYNPFVENPFENPKSEPLSTFSIDVDNASYTNIRRFINNGQEVPKNAVRVEEMVNFFKYSYEQPKGEDPFSIQTEYSDAPWNPKHKLLKIGLQGKIIPTEKLPASNLVFLIDVSGSMDEENKLPLLKQSLKILVNELRKEDKVSIVVYAGAAGMVLPPTSGDDKKTIIDALEKLNAGGSTAGGEGIELAYKTAQENFIKNGNNRVILATDGDFNVGKSSNADMETLIEEKRKSGVFLTCLGYGMGNYKDSKMQTLANKGNGNHAYIDNIQEANRFLGKEFKGTLFAIAKDVKIQIEFNPKHVQSYRLIGYEKRKLKTEDFTNDAIDAGELGSGHTVTALYEIIPVGVNSEFAGKTPDLKYTNAQENNTSYNDELATIKFRYKKPDGEKSIELTNVVGNKSIPLNAASNDFKFSAAVAWFGLKLRDSNLIPNKSLNDIKKLAKEGLSNDEEGYKAEFIRLVDSVK